LPASIHHLRVAGIRVASRQLTVSVDEDRCRVEGAAALQVTISPGA
jgi:hypothetical protein